MSRIEKALSSHRINKAISELAPREPLKEALGAAMYGLNSVWCWWEPNMIFRNYRADLEQNKRKPLEAKIDKYHPEWRTRAPKKGEIVEFLLKTQ
jgi:hypothetical protein